METGKMFSSDRYVTRGVHEVVPLELQLLLWSILENRQERALTAKSIRKSSNKSPVKISKPVICYSGAAQADLFHHDRESPRS